jgi:hypothetical protein
LALGRLRQKIHELEASLGHIVRPCFNNKKKKKKEREWEKVKEEKEKRE